MKLASTIMNYKNKNISYFSGIRHDWFNDLPKGKGLKILEIGCGSGDNGSYSKKNNYSSYYAGIEIVHKAAKEASSKLNEVICGNAETVHLEWSYNTFDVLFMSEVLEHFQDPVMFLNKIYPYLQKGCLVFSSSPNVSHYSVIKMLLKGEWRQEPQGILDETHLRWFTPSSYKKLFEGCGFNVTKLTSVSAYGLKAKVINMVTFGYVKHLFWRQINLQAKK